MHTLRRHRLVPLVMSIAAAAVVWAGSSSIAAASSGHRHRHTASLLTGTWSGSYSGTYSGSAYSGTFSVKLKQSGSALSGSIKVSLPSGTYGVTGHLHGRSFVFGAVAASAMYKGSVSGHGMSGTYTTPNGGGSWSAHKTS